MGASCSYRPRTFMQRQLIRIDTVNRQALMQRRKTHRQRTLCHSVTGQKRLTIKSAPTQRLRKVIQDLRADRLRTHARHTPGAQVKLLCFTFTQSTVAQLISKRWTNRDGCLIARHQRQPLLGTHRKLPRAKVIYGHL